MRPSISILLQAIPPAAPTPANALRIVSVVGLLIVLVVALGLVALHLRKRLLADDAAPAPGTMLEQMRAMLRRGEITQEEFDAMRRRMVERMSASSDTPRPLSTAARPARTPMKAPGANAAPRRTSPPRSTPPPGQDSGRGPSAEPPAETS